jgi:hypothetical protein
MKEVRMDGVYSVGEAAGEAECGGSKIIVLVVNLLPECL